MGHVPIMTNRRNGTLHIGVTGDLRQRVHLHRIGRGSDFCAKWGLTRRVLVEAYPMMLKRSRGKKR